MEINIKVLPIAITGMPSQPGNHMAMTSGLATLLASPPLLVKLLVRISYDSKQYARNWR